MTASGMPRISGFTLVRNGVEYDYPFLESLESLLPLVDELIINVGRGDDSTLQKVQELAKTNTKIKVFESTWPLDDPAKKKEGRILSEQTNLALDRCSGDWCIYLQADEVLHEDDHQQLLNAIKEAHAFPEIDGLLFEYRHFYGSYDVVQETRSSYRREVRAVRRSSGARSVGDAQSFRKTNDTKLNVIRCHARIFHYGWVRTPEAMKQKTFFMDQLYHGNATSEEARTFTPKTGDNYRYKKFWGLKRFSETHPSVMKTRIQKKGWHWDLSASPLTVTVKDVLKKIPLDLFERATGIRLFEYRSYKLLGDATRTRPSSHQT